MRWTLALSCLAASLGAAVSPDTTAKRTRAEIEAGLKALETKARTAKEEPKAPEAADKLKEGKGAKALVNDLVIKPDELKRARAELLRLNAYRYLCGLEADVVLKEDYNLTCKFGAYLCSVIGRIEHTPAKPAGLDELVYKKGYEGTSHSNLFWSSGPDGLTGSVNGYMDDSDASNIARVGHRRWCLNPPMGATGFGQVRGYSSMWSMDASNAAGKGEHIVCFPAAGFWPLAYWPNRPAWSISLDPGRYRVEDNPELKVYLLGGTDRFPQDTKGLKELKLTDVCVGREGMGIAQCVIFRPEVAPKRGNRFGVSLPVKGWRSAKLEYIVEFY
ncbi:MAG: hypothetical protein NTX41_02790 [Verrucomicrobia bacterium]|nr:hypothetical protein [Verrucomicrobiota bacterium]